jgi:hypothetical protein
MNHLPQLDHQDLLTCLLNLLDLQDIHLRFHHLTQNQVEIPPVVNLQNHLMTLGLKTGRHACVYGTSY